MHTGLSSKTRQHFYIILIALLMIDIVLFYIYIYRLFIASISFIGESNFVFNLHFWPHQNKIPQNTKASQIAVLILPLAHAEHFISMNMRCAALLFFSILVISFFLERNIYERIGASLRRMTWASTREVAAPVRADARIYIRYFADDFELNRYC